MVSTNSIGPLGQGGQLDVRPASAAKSFEPGGFIDYQRPGMVVSDAFELAKVAVALRRAEGREYYDVEADESAQAAYYRGIDADADPVFFFQALSEKLETSHTRKLSYSEARYDYLYPWVDLHPEDLKLHGVYTGEVFDPKRVIEEDRATDRKIAMLMQLGATVGGFLSEALYNARYNTEHSVPQSWFDKGEPMRGDLHCLFTSNIECNSLRGHLPFGEVNSSGIVCVDGCGEQGDNVFEPERSKGAVARATLYFLMRYPGLVEPHEMPRSTIEVLLKWNRENPPSLWEKHRNAETAKAQGNRNPLTDYPEWAERIDFLRGFGS